MLWGDSHADHMMPALIEAYPDVAVYQLTMAGCPPVIGFELKIPPVSKSCAEFNRKVLLKIDELKKDGLERRRDFRTLANLSVAASHCCHRGKTKSGR